MLYKKKPSFFASIRPPEKYTPEKNVKYILQNTTLLIFFRKKKGKNWFHSETTTLKGKNKKISSDINFSEDR